MKIKNKEIFELTTILSSLKLEGQPSHARRRFLRLLKPFVEDQNEARNELREKYADKDTAGKPKMNGQAFTFSGENKKKLLKESTNLGEIEVEIDLGTANKKDVNDMKKILQDNVKDFEVTKKGEYTADEFEYIEVVRNLIAIVK